MINIEQSTRPISLFNVFIHSSYLYYVILSQLHRVAYSRVLSTTVLHPLLPQIRPTQIGPRNDMWLSRYILWLARRNFKNVYESWEYLKKNRI